MKAAYITKKIYMVFLLAVLLSAGCGPNNQSDPDPIGIKIKSPKFDEIAGIYTDVTPSLKFTSSSGGVTECNVFIGTDTKVKGTCGDMRFGTYAYNLEYRYQDVSIAKSIGSITIDENNTEIPITVLDKGIDEDKDGCSNLQEVIVGSNPNVQDTCIPPPTDLKATAKSTVQIDLTWTESSGATGYKIFRREGSDGADAEIGTTTQTSYSDTGLKADTTYCYKVSANGNGAESIPTDPVCGKTESGLVAFYPFNGNTNDESGNGNDGTVNGATLTTDRFGNVNSAYSLDGIDDYISVPDADEVDFTYNQNFSVITWIKPDIQIETTRGSNIVIEKWSGSGGYAYRLHYVNHTNVDNGSINVGRYDGNNNPNFTSKNKINDNQFHHIAFTKENSKLNLFIDGILDSTTTDTTTGTTTNNSNLFLGQRGNNVYHFKGVIDDFRIYNRALTDAEVLALYNEGK